MLPHNLQVSVKDRPPDVVFKLTGSPDAASSPPPYAAAEYYLRYPLITGTVTGTVIA